MPDGRGHAPDLTISSFDQSKSNPAIRNLFSEPNGRMAGRHQRLRLEQPGVAGQRSTALDNDAFLQRNQRLRRRETLDLGPINSLVPLGWVQQPIIQSGLVAQEEQTFRIRIEPADGIDFVGKAELGQRAVGRPIGGELGEDAIRFMKGDEHAPSMPQRREIVPAKNAKEREKKAKPPGSAGILAGEFDALTPAGMPALPGGNRAWLIKSG